jgi:hypothetical protein
LVYVNVFNVQRAGVRSQRSRAYFDVLLHLALVWGDPAKMVGSVTVPAIRLLKIDDAFCLFLQKQQIAYRHIPIGYPRER